MKNLVYKICVGIVSFLQTLLFWMFIIGLSTKSAGSDSNTTLGIVGMVAFLLIANVIDKFLRKEDGWWCVLINVIFAPVRFITQILGYVLSATKGYNMQRGAYDNDSTKCTLVYYLTSIDLSGNKKDLPSKAVLAAMQKIASEENDAVYYPSGAVLRMHTEVTVEGHKISFKVVGVHENFELIKDADELKKHEGYVVAAVKDITKEIDAKCDQWYKAQKCEATYELNVDFVERP